MACPSLLRERSTKGAEYNWTRCSIIVVGLVLCGLSNLRRGVLSLFGCLLCLFEYLTVCVELNRGERFAGNWVTRFRREGRVD